MSVIADLIRNPWLTWRGDKGGERGHGSRIESGMTALHAMSKPHMLRPVC